MGCNFNFRVLSAKTVASAKKEVINIMKNDAHEFGHGGYTGTFAEADGVVLNASVFDTPRKAADWLVDNSEKWGPAVIVKIKNGGFCVGANCSS